VSNNAPIGVFDSGLGGLSTLAELIHLLPKEDYVFFGDTGNNPYGTKPVPVVQDLTWNGVSFLISRGIKALVIACNTATSVVIEDLRAKLEIPVFGIEPAVKPAITSGEQGKALIMATPLTIMESKFKQLLESLQGGKNSAVPLACPGLAELIEVDNQPGIRQRLKELFETIDKKEISSVVLGCTHYAFVKDEIQAALGKQVHFFDGAEGLARHVQHVLTQDELLNEAGQGNVEYHMTGPVAEAQTVRAREIVDLLLSRKESCKV
jgi:glutamate racemase